MTIRGQLIRYRCACNALLSLFCAKQGFSPLDTYWVADRVGEVADCAEHFFSMDDIITDLEEESPPGKILEWYDQLESLGCKVNYRHWLHGCPAPRKSELEELHRKAEEARKEFNDEIENFLD